MDILHEIIKTAIIALFSALFTLTWAYSTDAIKKRKFRKVFGRSVLTAQDVTVSVGLWQVSENNERRPRFIKGANAPFFKSLYGPNNVYSKEDIVASNHLLNITSSHFGERSIFINDLEPLSWDGSTILLIGNPLSNIHSGIFYKQINDVASFKVPEFIELDENDKNASRCLISDKISSREWRSDSDKDYGLILKAKNFLSSNKMFNIFLIAGIHAESTHEAGRLFAQNWRIFSSGKDIMWSVFEMLRDKPGTGKFIVSSKS